MSQQPPDRYEATCLTPFPVPRNIVCTTHTWHGSAYSAGSGDCSRPEHTQWLSLPNAVLSTLGRQRVPAGMTHVFQHFICSLALHRLDTTQVEQGGVRQNPVLPSPGQQSTGNADLLKYITLRCQCLTVPDSSIHFLPHVLLWIPDITFTLPS